MKTKSFERTTPNDIRILIVISAILVIAIIAFWSLGFKNESILTGILGVSIWAFRTITNRYFVRIDRKVDEQKQILLQGTQAGFGFKQIVMKNMYDVTSQLWERSIWITSNWNALWPGRDTEAEETFDKKLRDYAEFLKVSSINIPSKIYKASSKLVEGIGIYRSGRMEREDEYADGPTRRHGHEDMSKGAKMVGQAMTEMFQSIRDEFGLDSLPGEILKIEQPEELNS